MHLWTLPIKVGKDIIPGTRLGLLKISWKVHMKYLRFLMLFRLQCNYHQEKWNRSFSCFWLFWLPSQSRVCYQNQGSWRWKTLDALYRHGCSPNWFSTGKEYSTFVKSLSLFIIVLAALLRQVFSFNLCEDLLLLFVAQKSLISWMGCITQGKVGGHCTMRREW